MVIVTWKTLVPKHIKKKEKKTETNETTAKNVPTVGKINDAIMEEDEDEEEGVDETDKTEEKTSEDAFGRKLVVYD